jgi:hypothetical protein
MASKSQCVGVGMAAANRLAKLALKYENAWPSKKGGPSALESNQINSESENNGGGDHQLMAAAALASLINGGVISASENTKMAAIVMSA